MTAIDPHERWKPHGRPDYAGLQSFGARPYTESVDDLARVDVAVVGAPLDELVTAGSIRSRRCGLWTSATQR